jgi:hypothetical protein
MDAMPRKRGLPNWLYYLCAVLISALTIPMYRYMFEHAGSARSEPAMVKVAVVRDDVSPVPPPAPVRVPLSAGQLCEAGYVVLKNGNVYTQGIDVDGRPMRCAGGYLLAVPQ